MPQMSQNEQKIRVAGYVPESIVDGVGLRFTLFVQGCSHRCPGCQNPQTHPAEGGRWMDAVEIMAEIVKNPLLSGVTFSGGEPFEQAGPLAELAGRVKARGLHLCSYTGYTFEQLVGMNDAAVRRLLERCDVLVDGPFLLEQRTLEKRFAGSRNQRCLDVAASLREGKPVLQEGWQ